MAKRRKKYSPIDTAIHSLNKERSQYAPGSAERRAIDSELSVLYAQRSNEARSKREWVPAVIGGVVGLAQVILILNKEDIACVTSKAIGFVMKPKL